MFHVQEHAWEALSSFAKVCGAMGVSHLLKAYGYFSVASFFAPSSGQDWDAIILQVVVVLLDALLAGVCMAASPRVSLVLGVFVIVAPVASFLSMLSVEHQWVDQVCIPACLICHFMCNVVGLACLAAIVKAFDNQAHNDGAPPGSPLGKPRATSFGEIATLSPKQKRTGNGGESDHLDRPPQSKRVIQMIFLGNGVVLLAWFATACWAIYHAYCGDHDKGVRPIRLAMPSPPRALRSKWSMRAASSHDDGLWAHGKHMLLASLEKVEISWPSPRFVPHAMACGCDGSCFVANEYLVFQMHHTSSGGWSATEASCNVPGVIVDLATQCRHGRSHPAALVYDSSGAPQLVDCSLKDEEPQPKLRIHGEAQRLAFGDGESGGLFVAQRLEVVEFAQRPAVPAPKRAEAATWAPRWPVGEVRSSEGLAAIELLRGSGSPWELLTLHGSGLLELVDVDTRASCGTWSLPFDSSASSVSSGSVRGQQNSLMLLLRSGQHVQLMSIELSQIVGACRRQRDEPSADNSGRRLRGVPKRNSAE